MRRIALCLALLALGACTTRAEREMTRMDQVATAGTQQEAACVARVLAAPEFGSVKERLALGATPTLEQQGNQAKPTDGEVRELYRYHAAVTPCRKIRLETAGRINPALVSLYAERYAGQDAILVDLTAKRETWGGAIRRGVDVDTRIARNADAIGRQMMAGLNQAHANELENRRLAGVALAQWGYQMQALDQQQQMINAMYRPTFTTCAYAGPTLNCTTQ